MIYLRSDVQVIDGESCPSETSAAEREGDADDDGRPALNHEGRQGHEQSLADVRPAREQLPNLETANLKWKGIERKPVL